MTNKIYRMGAEKHIFFTEVGTLINFLFSLQKYQHSKCLDWIFLV